MQVKIHRVDETPLYFNSAAVEALNGEAKGFYLPLEKIRKAGPAGNQNRVCPVYIQDMISDTCNYGR